MSIQHQMNQLANHGMDMDMGMEEEYDDEDMDEEDGQYYEPNDHNEYNPLRQR